MTAARVVRGPLAATRAREARSSHGTTASAHAAIAPASAHVASVHVASVHVASVHAAFLHAREASLLYSPAGSTCAEETSG